MTWCHISETFDQAQLETSTQRALPLLQLLLFSVVGLSRQNGDGYRTYGPGSPASVPARYPTRLWARCRGRVRRLLLVRVQHLPRPGQEPSCDFVWPPFLLVLPIPMESDPAVPGWQQQQQVPRMQGQHGRELRDSDLLQADGGEGRYRWEDTAAATASGTETGRCGQDSEPSDRLVYQQPSAWVLWPPYWHQRRWPRGRYDSRAAAPSVPFPAASAAGVFRHLVSSVVLTPLTAVPSGTKGPRLQLLFQ